jgi:2'-5' RNA ligase
VGEEPERREFRPHVTVARPRGQVDVGGLVDALNAASPGPAWIPSETVLFESLPARDGVTHVARARFSLTG